MIILDDLKQSVVSSKSKLDELYRVLNIKNIEVELEELHQKASEPEFWNDTENSQKVLQKTKSIENKIENYNRLCTKYDDCLTLIELALEESDDDLVSEIDIEVKSYLDKLDEITLTTLLTGKYDTNNAILDFHAGAGGTEAQDWTEMLLRMYTRWGENHGYKVSVLDCLDGTDAGIKSASVMFEGENAYGFLKSESGIHRLVRISPFDSSGSRHTSFAAVSVMPEIDDTIEVDIRPEDLDVSTFRASGAGGQHINKTDSAVRIVHKPTGIVVSCQTQRSQFQNKDYCMKMLRAKLIEIKERENLATIADIKGVQKEIAWGSQIRSYVFMPYTLVKDHRTGFENGNVSNIMDGDLDGFINAYLKFINHGEKSE